MKSNWRDNLRETLFKKGMTVDDLAGKTGISRVSLYAILNGKTESPRAPTVAKILAALSITGKAKDDMLKQILRSLTK
jgi:transcriptional regulator with XRE-family HTH domain